MRPHPRLLLPLALAIVCCASTARAQDTAPSQTSSAAPLQLALTLEASASDPNAQSAPPLDPEALRSAIALELGVPVELASNGSQASTTLAITASSLRDVRVSFGGSQRVVDLSNSGPHTTETLSLIAANLMRDEASDLLASLHAATPTPSPGAVPAAPIAAPAPASPSARAPSAAPRAPRGCDTSLLRRVPLNANLVPWVGTSTMFGTEIEQLVALNVIGGAAAGLRGFELAGLFNVESHAVCGVHASGGVNIVTGPLQGGQLSVLNWVSGRTDGAQLGFVNVGAGELAGLQLAFFNLAGDRSDGAQLGFVNISANDLEGSQVGFANVDTGSMEGAQVGFVNTTARSARGAQVGFANVASELHGVQLGFANVTTGRARGLMLGMLNIAGDADAALGVLSIHLHGRTQLDSWVTDAGLVMAGIEHGGRIFHNLAGAGFTFRDGNPVFAFAYGLGARVYDSSRWYTDVDAVGYGLLANNDTTNKMSFGSILQLRVPIGYRLSPAVSLFAAPAINVSAAKSQDNVLHKPGLYGARVTSSTSSTSGYIWPGITAGARFF